MTPLRHLRSLLLAALLAGVAGCGAGSEERAAWDPDQVPEAYARSVAALLWPGATRAFQVTPEGDLFNGAWRVRLEVGEEGRPAAAPRAIAYEERWLPVVRWTRVAGDLRWEFEAVALPEDPPAPAAAWRAAARALAARRREADRASVDAVFAAVPASRADALLLRAPRPLERDPLDRANLIVSLAVTVENRGRTPREARAEWRLEPAGRGAPYRDPDSLLREPWHSGWGAAAGRDSVMGWAEGAAAGRAVRAAFRLAPGERRTLRAALPAYPMPQGTLERWARVPHQRRVARVRAFWRREASRGAVFDVPDPEVAAALRAARVLLLALRERRLERWVPIGGPFHYRDVWLRDGARAIAALAVLGYTGEARALAASFLAYQWPHGPFVSQGGQLDGTGQALWALEQAMLRPGPAPGIARHAAAAERAWRALERCRRLGGRTPGERPGLLPATDPHDAELVEAQLVGNDAWAIAGTRSAERLLRAAGRAALADTVAAAARAYAATFREALAPHRDVPPSWQGIGTDWGNLAVGYPCRALEPGETRLAAMARRHFAVTGGAGLGHYRDPDAAHGYVAADLGTWAMLAGERALADSVLDASLAWRSASGGAAEIFSRSRRDFGVNFPPHPTAAAAWIALVRNALLHDDADTLQIALGARAGWWRGTRVRRAPTRWGRVDLDLALKGNVATWRWTRVPVPALLALPPGTALAGPLPEGFAPGPRPDLVVAPPGCREARLIVAPLPAGAPPLRPASAGAPSPARRPAGRPASS